MMAWNDIPRWKEMSREQLVAESGFPPDADAIYVNKCYELEYVSAHEMDAWGIEEYSEFIRGAVFEMLHEANAAIWEGRGLTPPRWRSPLEIACPPWGGEYDYLWTHDHRRDW